MLAYNKLPADLPENWTTSQTVAPEGEITGLSPQHGYNYLMKAVNDAHHACNLLRAECGALRKELENKANVEKPVEYALPLVSGITGNASTYLITQENLVTVYISANNTSGNFSASQVIATLPAGFRPSSRRLFLAYYNNASTGISYALFCETNGNIVLASDLSPVYNTLRTSFSFLAAQ